MELNARIPAGPLEKKWDRHRFEMKLVNPANKRKHTVIVVGTGLGGGAAAEARADDDDRVFPLVRRIHQLHLEAVAVPFLFERPCRNA